jgi:hypothetical protein
VEPSSYSKRREDELEAAFFFLNNNAVTGLREYTDRVNVSLDVEF